MRIGRNSEFYSALRGARGSARRGRKRGKTAEVWGCACEGAARLCWWGVGTVTVDCGRETVEAQQKDLRAYMCLRSWLVLVRCHSRSRPRVVVSVGFSFNFSFGRRPARGAGVSRSAAAAPRSRQSTFQRFMARSRNTWAALMNCLAFIYCAPGLQTISICEGSLYEASHCRS